MNKDRVSQGMAYTLAAAAAKAPIYRLLQAVLAGLLLFSA